MCSRVEDGDICRLVFTFGRTEYLGHVHCLDLDGLIVQQADNQSGVGGWTGQTGLGAV
jgi:hypothetical protein